VLAWRVRQALIAADFRLEIVQQNDQLEDWGSSAARRASRLVSAHPQRISRTRCACGSATGKFGRPGVRQLWAAVVQQSTSGPALLPFFPFLLRR
jgi:hypothetical protein